MYPSAQLDSAIDKIMVYETLLQYVVGWCLSRTLVSSAANSHYGSLVLLKASSGVTKIN